jgi:hypothetical protein
LLGWRSLACSRDHSSEDKGIVVRPPAIQLLLASLLSCNVTYNSKVVKENLVTTPESTGLPEEGRLLNGSLGSNPFQATA